MEKSQKECEIDILTVFNPNDMKDCHGSDVSDLQDQILFYYPPNQTLSNQIVNIGLAQTLDAFTNQFKENPSSSFGLGENKLDTNAPTTTAIASSYRTESMKCKSKDPLIWKCAKSKSILINLEGDYWILMRIKFGSKTIKEKSGKMTKIITDWEITDEFLTWLITQTFDRFKLLYHSFSKLRSQSQDAMELFKQKIEGFFSTAILSIQRACQNPSFEYIMNDGIKNCSFDETVFGKIVALAARLSSIIPILNGQFMLLYNDGLAWSSLPTHLDTSHLYSFLVDPLTGNVDDTLINQVKSKGEPVISSSTDSNFSGFLIGPDFTSIDKSSENRNIITVKQVYLADGTPHVIILYQWCSEYTICLLSSNLDSQEFQRLGWYLFLQDTLVELLQSLKDHIKNQYRVSKSLAGTTGYQGQYCALSANLTTLVVKSWFSFRKGKTDKQELMQVLSKARQMLTSTKKDSRDILLKTSCGWVCAMNSGMGQVILIINKDDITLGTVQGEISYLKGIIQFTLDPR